MEVKIGRNQPCPCGSGKKYKKCCLPKEVTTSVSVDQSTEYDPEPDSYLVVDDRSNRIADLIDDGHLAQAEIEVMEFHRDYPDQVDHLYHLGRIYGRYKKFDISADYFRQAAEFAASNEGFDSDSIAYYKDLEAQALQHI